MLKAKKKTPCRPVHILRKYCQVLTCIVAVSWVICVWSTMSVSARIWPTWTIGRLVRIAVIRGILSTHVVYKVVPTLLNVFWRVVGVGIVWSRTRGRMVTVLGMRPPFIGWCGIVNVGPCRMGSSRGLIWIIVPRSWSLVVGWGLWVMMGLGRWLCSWGRGGGGGVVIRVGWLRLGCWVSGQLMAIEVIVYMCGWVDRGCGCENISSWSLKPGWVFCKSISAS